MPADPATAQWIDAVNQIRFTSASGDGVNAGVLFAFPMSTRSSRPELFLDQKRGLVEICAEAAQTSGGPVYCSYRVYLRRADVPDAPGAAPASLDGTQIGWTYAQLLTQFHADAVRSETFLSSKNITKGPAGSVVRIDASYVGRHVDHGWDGGDVGYTYLLVDGVVVAEGVYGIFG
jgi:hypothetical protein